MQAGDVLAQRGDACARLVPLVQLPSSPCQSPLPLAVCRSEEAPCRGLPAWPKPSPAQPCVSQRSSRHPCAPLPSQPTGGRGVVQSAASLHWDLALCCLSAALAVCLCLPACPCDAIFFRAAPCQLPYV